MRTSPPNAWLHPVEDKSVLFVCWFPAEKFSGGRYSVLASALALARRGANVTVLSNCVPKIWDEFAGRGGAERVKFRSWKSRLDETLGDHDLLIAVPNFGGLPIVELVSLFLRLRHRLPMWGWVFETPNWKRKSLDVQVDSRGWQHWDRFAEKCDGLITISETGRKYALEYYSSRQADSVVAILPAINSDALRQVGGPRETFRVLVVLRISGGSHKGIKNLERLMRPALRGYVVTVITDMPGDPELARCVKTAQLFGVEVEIISGVSDDVKFHLFRQSAITVCLSTFEGFGYLPVESLACGVPCIGYDLEVYREVTSDKMEVTAVNDTVAFREKLFAMLEAQTTVADRVQNWARTEFSIERYGEDLWRLLGASEALVQRTRNIRRSVFGTLFHLTFTVTIMLVGRLLGRVGRKRSRNKPI